MQDSFEHFYVGWYSRAKHFAQEYVLVEKDAENIVQDTFLKIYEQWDSFDEDINLTSYLFTSIKNRSLKMLRRNLVAEKAKSSIHIIVTIRRRHCFSTCFVAQGCAV